MRRLIARVTIDGNVKKSRSRDPKPTSSRSRIIKRVKERGAKVRGTFAAKTFSGAELEYERASGTNIIVRDSVTGAAYTIPKASLPKSAQPSRKVTEVHHEGIHIKIVPPSGRFKPHRRTKKPPTLFEAFAAKGSILGRARADRDVEVERQRLAKLAEDERRAAEQVRQRIAATELQLYKRVDDSLRLVDPLTSEEIAAALASNGIQVEPQRLDLPSRIESAGTYSGVAHLHHGCDAPLRLIVNPLFSDAQLWSLVVEQLRSLNEDVTAARRLIGNSLGRGA